jgi:uncharacterized protein (DUF2345 family)
MPLKEQALYLKDLARMIEMPFASRIPKREVVRKMMTALLAKAAKTISANPMLQPPQVFASHAKQTTTAPPDMFVQIQQRAHDASCPVMETAAPKAIDVMARGPE